jgi:hypothetical protein
LTLGGWIEKESETACGRGRFKFRRAQRALIDRNPVNEILFLESI